MSLPLLQRRDPEVSRASGMHCFHLTQNFPSLQKREGILSFKRRFWKADIGWVQGRCSHVRAGTVLPSKPAQPKVQFLPKKPPLTQNKEALVASNNLLPLRLLQFRPNWGFLGEGNCCIAATAWSGYHIKVSGFFSEILNIFFIADQKQQQQQQKKDG